MRIKKTYKRNNGNDSNLANYTNPNAISGIGKGYTNRLNNSLARIKAAVKVYYELLAHINSQKLMGGDTLIQAQHQFRDFLNSFSPMDRMWVAKYAYRMYK